MSRWNNQQIEAIKLATEEMQMIAIPLQLFEDLLQVCDWLESSVSSLRAGETMETHPDWNAVEYLEGEARAIRLQACGYLPAIQRG